MLSNVRQCQTCPLYTPYHHTRSGYGKDGWMASGSHPAHHWPGDVQHECWWIEQTGGFASLLEGLWLNTQILSLLIRACEMSKKPYTDVVKHDGYVFLFLVQLLMPFDAC